MAQDLVIFDTSALPEYYDDVHKILALPNGHIVTYDYGEGNVSAEAIEVLRKKKAAPLNRVRAVLAYIQPWDYTKGAGLTGSAPLAEPTFQALTRLANIVEVREVTNNTTARFYVDLELLGYPRGKDRSVANSIVGELRRRSEIPMKTYIAICPGKSAEALFTPLVERSQEQGFSQVVDAISTKPSRAAAIATTLSGIDSRRHAAVRAHFQILFPLPGRPNSLHIASTLSTTA